MLRRASICWLGLWLGVLVALGTGCGASKEDGEASPSAAAITRAVLTSLLSNSVEARKSEPGPEPTPPPQREGSRPEPGPPPAAPGGAGTVAADDRSQGPETCEIPYNGPVTIIRSPSPSAFARAVDARPRVRLVYETDDTAIWEDGRVLTTDVENLGNHLNAVGWASNPMQIAGASARPGASGRNLGWDSATSSFQQKDQKQKRKKRRRRG
jgi:hypothetical protein